MLEAETITVSYEDRIALREFSVNLSPRSITAIIGPNGAGKSTLIRALNGSIPLAGGVVRLYGQPLNSYSRRAVGRRIAVVAQEAELRFPITVYEFVLGARYSWSSVSSWGWETGADLRMASAAIAEAELIGFEGRLMNELSGGERQRALVARALASEASILLLDEPTANLDLSHQAAILSLVGSRCKSRNASAVFVTHDLNLAAEFADRVILVKEGQAVASGVPEKVLTPGLLRQVFDVEVLIDKHPVSGAPRVTPVHMNAGEILIAEPDAGEDGESPPLPAQL